MSHANVIAEIGINHNGSIDKAIDMATAAKNCGADYVKLQKRQIESCYTKEELLAPCESPWGHTVADKVRGRELSWDDVREFSFHCGSIDIGWSCSCFDLESLDYLEAKFGGNIGFHKVPSSMSKYKEFNERVAEFQRMALVSVGLAEDLNEIISIARIYEERDCPYVLNVTTSLYPCPVDRCHVKRVEGFLSAFNINKFVLCRGIGYSGHETGILPSLIAATLGASFIERHFTLDRSWYGADQSASLEPEGLRRLCRDVGIINKIMGSADVQLEGDEKNPVKRLAR